MNIFSFPVLYIARGEATVHTHNILFLMNAPPQVYPGEEPLYILTNTLPNEPFFPSGTHRRRVTLHTYNCILFT
jgi:hypothetical protein